MKTSKTTREQALEWFNSKASLEKTRLCDTNTEIVGKVRRWETLTGREIEQIYLSEHPTQPEQTIKEEWQIDKDGVGNLCVWKNKTKIAAVHNNNYDIANLIASAPRLAKENKELKEELDLSNIQILALQNKLSGCESALETAYEQNKLLREALEMVYKRLHIFGESNVWEDEDEMALHRAQKALTQ